MILSNIPTFSSDEFSFKNGRFVAEMSTLSQGSTIRVFGQIYDDACDEGLAITSAKTGKTMIFYVKEVFKDTERDVILWALEPIPQNLSADPALRTLDVHILND